MGGSFVFFVLDVLGFVGSDNFGVGSWGGGFLGGRVGWVMVVLVEIRLFFLVIDMIDFWFFWLEIGCLNFFFVICKFVIFFGLFVLFFFCWDCVV